MLSSAVASVEDCRGSCSAMSRPTHFSLKLRSSEPTFGDLLRLQLFAVVVCFWQLLCFVFCDGDGMREGEGIGGKRTRGGEDVEEGLVRVGTRTPQWYVWQKPMFVIFLPLSIGLRLKKHIPVSPFSNTKDSEPPPP